MASAYSTISACIPKVYLSTPTAPTAASAWTTFRSSGYLKPRHLSGSHTVVLQAQRYENGAWVLRKTVSTTNANYSTYTRYAGSVNLPGPGPRKWRIRAYSPADSLHAATYSGWRYVTVRAQRVYSVRGSVSDSTPKQNTNVTAYARVKDRTGHAIPGATVKFTWRFKTVTRTTYAKTNSSGVAASTRYIGAAAKGFKVVVSLTASAGGATATGSTYFVPWGSTTSSSPTVYITETGSKFHRAGCQYLSHSAIAISRAEAIAQGYTACSVCKP